MNDLLSLRLELDEAITYGDIDKAKKLAKDGISIAHREEDLAEMEYFKGQAEILNEDYIKAITHFDKAIMYNPKDGASYNDRALCMIELGDAENALKYFDKGIEKESDFATIYHNKGWLLSKLGMHNEAIDCLKKALELDPKRSVTYENLADIYLKKGDNKRALENYNKAIELLKPEYAYIKEELMKQIRMIHLGGGPKVA